MRFDKKTPGPAMTEMLKKCGDTDMGTARAALAQLAKALTLPLRQGVLKGDIVTDIYAKEVLAPGSAPEYPLDFYNSSTENEHVAYTIPAQGRIPERHVEGDFVMVPTYEVGNSIDFALKYARDARWNIVGRAMEVLEAGFVRKMNTDGWRVLVGAGFGRSLVVFDDAVPVGFLSKRLVELMKNIMRRNAGGNSTSVNRGKLTHLYISPESHGDIRSWDLTQVDDVTRRDIFMAEEEGLNRVFGVNLRSIDELGVGQEFQNYYSTSLGGTMPTYTLGSSLTKVEIAVGLDLSKDDAFVMPVRQEIEVHEDPTFHRQRRASMYAFGEHGFACLDARRVLLGAI